MVVECFVELQATKDSYENFDKTLEVLLKSWIKKMKQNKEIKQTGQERKKLFLRFFDSYYKSFISGRKTGH